MSRLSYSQKRKLNSVVYYIFTSILFILFISPLLWMVVSSFKPETMIFSDMASIKALIPRKVTIENYVGALKSVPLLRYIINTLFTVSLIVILGLVVNSLCGYALARLKVPGKRFILSLIVALIIVPFQSILIPVYLIAFKLGMINKFSALIIPFIVNCFNIYLFKQFFMSIPKELEEAAYIDGASVIKTFVEIIIPLSKPVFATVAILTFTSYWSDFLWPLLVTSDISTRTVQVGLQLFFTEPPWNYGYIMAALTLGTAPMVIIFLMLQKYYIQGITSSGVKG